MLWKHLSPYPTMLSLPKATSALYQVSFHLFAHFAPSALRTPWSCSCSTLYPTRANCP